MDGLILQKAAPQPDNLASVRARLPTDLRARRARAPLGLPAAPLILDRKYYTLGFDPSIKSPRWVGFTVDAARALQLRRLPDRPDFDPAIPPEWQTGEEVYRNNRYDRGALVRRADAAIGADETEARAADAEVYYFSVTVPQIDMTNRVTWSAVENYTTGLSALAGPVHVVAGPVYQDSGAYLTLGQSRTAVPLSLYRVLLRRATDGNWRAIGFLVPNDGSGKRDHRSFATSVAAVEKLTGLTFFPDLPPEAAAALKANDSLEAFER